MFCVKCGSEMKEGAQFCTNCGAAQGKGIPYEAKPGGAVKSPLEGNKLKILLICGAVLILIVAAIIIFLPRGKSTESTGTTEIAEENHEMDEFLGQWELETQISSPKTMFCEYPSYLSITENGVQMPLGDINDPTVTGKLGAVSDDEDGIRALHFTATYTDHYPDNLETVTLENVFSGIVVTDMFDHDLRVYYKTEEQVLRLETYLAGQWCGLGEFKKVN